MPELPGIQKELGLETQDLIPASLSMSSASGHPLPILGAALIRLKLKNSGRSTRQMIYFSAKLYLSLATCTDLGLIGSQFSLGISPQPASQSTRSTTTTANVVPRPNHHLHPHQETASLPPRALTPLQCREEQPPNQAGHARAHREHHHPRCLHRYHSLGRRRTATGLSVTCWTTAASAFNVCEHQPLPMPPLSLTIDPKAIPKPCHTPITVPVHWQDEVKAEMSDSVFWRRSPWARPSLGATAW